MRHSKLNTLVFAMTFGAALAAGAQTNYYGTKETNTLPGPNKAYPAPAATVPDRPSLDAQSACAGLAGTEQSDCLRNNSPSGATGGPNNNPSGPTNSSGPSNATGTSKAGGGSSDGGGGNGAGSGAGSAAGTGGASGSANGN